MAMDEHPNHILRETEARNQAMLRRSSAESDRKFWTGERPISLLQWVGILLMFLTVGVLVSFNYRAHALVFGALVLFVVLGNRWARRGTHPSNKR
jgi:hypothetical protein